MLQSESVADPIGAAGRPNCAPSEGTPADPECRVEDWLAGHLDGVAAPGPAGDGPLAAWSLSRRVAPARSGKAGTDRADDGWRRLRIARSGAATIARLIDAHLIKEPDVREAADELTELVRAGGSRLVLSFAAVERLSSGIVGAVARLDRLCAEADGRLKLCGLRPDLARLFEIVGMAGRLTICPDERAALDGPWPEPTGPRPLPITILAALTESPIPPPTRKPGPGGPPRGGPEGVALVVEVGRDRRRSVPLSGDRLVIGRDPACGLRIDHPTVSRWHAQLVRRGDAVVIRDLGSTNGTFVNDARLAADPVDLRPGDRIRVGPLAFALAGAAAGPVDEDIATWLRDDADAGDRSDDGPTQYDLATTAGPIRSEVVEGVLVVTPRASRLDDPDVVATFRSTLMELAEGSAPRRLVIDLSGVLTLSSRAIAVLTAHHVRLARQGGGLRLCGANARVRAALDSVRLPLLIGLHPNLDDAVLAAWD